MKNYLEYKGYLGTVEYSGEDDCLYGKVMGIKGLISYEGDSLTQLKADFHQAVDDYLEMCVEKKVSPEKAFKGSFNIRIGADLHRDLALKAQEKNMSINSFIKDINYFAPLLHNTTPKVFNNILISSPNDQ